MFDVYIQFGPLHGTLILIFFAESSSMAVVYRRTEQARPAKQDCLGVLWTSPGWLSIHGLTAWRVCSVKIRKKLERTETPKSFPNLCHHVLLYCIPFYGSSCLCNDRQTQRVVTQCQCVLGDFELYGSIRRPQVRPVKLADSRYVATAIPQSIAANRFIDIDSWY